MLLGGCFAYAFAESELFKTMIENSYNWIDTAQGISNYITLHAPLEKPVWQKMKEKLLFLAQQKATR
jgi:hypothetical protein